MRRMPCVHQLLGRLLFFVAAWRVETRARNMPRCCLSKHAGFVDCSTCFPIVEEKAIPFRINEKEKSIAQFCFLFVTKPSRIRPRLRRARAPSIDRSVEEPTLPPRRSLAIAFAGFAACFRRALTRFAHGIRCE
jgi:hypothetical protein